MDKWANIYALYAGDNWQMFISVVPVDHYYSSKEEALLYGKLPEDKLIPNGHVVHMRKYITTIKVE